MHLTARADGQLGRRERFLILILAALLAVGLGWAACQWRTAPRLAVPVPRNLGRLEPQLRHFLRSKILWARQAPNDFKRQSTLGLAYAANELWSDALACFENAAKLYPDNPLAGMYVGVCLDALGKWPEAAAQYRRVQQRSPKFAPGWSRLGDLLLRQGDLAGAGLAFKRLIETAPAEWRGYAGLGQIRLRQNNLPEAERLLKRALELDPEAKEAHHLLGTVYEREGKTADARVELRLGLNAIHYPMPDPWSDLAASYDRLLQDEFDLALKLADSGRGMAAVRILTNALEFQTNNVEILCQLAYAYDQAGRPDRAKPPLVRALELQPKRMLSYALLSTICLDMQQTNQALAAADQAVALSPKAPAAHIARSTALQGLGRWTDAARELETAFACDPQNPAIQFDLGDLYYIRLRQPAEALAHYQQALQVDPGFADAYFRIAEIKIAQGDATGAAAALESGKRYAPRHPAVGPLEARLRRMARPGPIPDPGLPNRNRNRNRDANGGGR